MRRVSPIPVFPVGKLMDDPVAMSLIDVYRITVNLAGLPAMSVPAGTSAEGLFLGLQMVGKPFEEGTVTRVGEALT
jgi:aspartyl-tRNA(Asn)/glutamyl-tRNA(Gln) amidotransferase subunit A